MNKKYKKTIVFILITLIIILTFNPVSSKNTILTSDQLDQEQIESSGKDYIYTSHWKAQTFKPTTKTLTRIQLYINKIGEITSDFEIFIRDSLTGSNLTTYSVPSQEIPLTNPEWIEFNFEDINVTVDQTYYIICKTTSGDPTNSYNWYESTDDPYNRGVKYYSDNTGTTWLQDPDLDFCFKTYGQKGKLEIQYITGGFGWNIYYGIKNMGTFEVNNTNVYINFSGGLILTEKTFTDSITQSIPPGEIFEDAFYPVIGFGPTTITLNISSPEAISTSKTVEAFLFFFSIYVRPS